MASLTEEIIQAQTAGFTHPQTAGFTHPGFTQKDAQTSIPEIYINPNIRGTKCKENQRNLTQGGSSIFRDPNFEDDEGDPMADKGSPFYKTVKSFQLDTLEQGKNFAKSYQQSKFGKSMDDNNKKALDVMVNKGANEAANYMMKQAGGDYSRMRSMFG